MTRRLTVLAALAAAALAVTAAPAAAAPPILTLGATTPEYVSAQVRGTIDPADNDTGYNFQYSTDPVTEGWIDGPGWLEQYVAAGSGVHAVEENLHEVPGSCCPTFGIALKPGTTYKLRLKATNNGEEFFSSVGEFTTLPVAAPNIVSVADAANVGNYTADVSGVVERPVGSNPAFDVGCRFEYISDAAYAPRNEKQQVRVRATGGTFTLSFGGETTAPIAYNAPPATVQAALRALASIGSGGVTVSGGPGSASGAFPYAVVFTGPLAVKDVEQMTGDGSALVEPGEGSPEVTTATDGHPEGFQGGSEAPCDPNPIKDPGTGPVVAQLGGLKAKTKYHLRLVVSNAGGSDSQEANTFTTTGRPVALTQSASEVQAGAATLGGKVNPVDGPVTYQFEWGPVEGSNDETYENVAPAEPETLPFEDENMHVVTAPISGLAPSTNYHYRLVATNLLTSEESAGVDRVFTTLAAPGPPVACPNESSRVGPSAGLPDCRAYEFATPGLNSSSPPGWPGLIVKAVRSDGSAIAFITSDAADADEGATAITNTFLASRGPAGWTAKGLSAATPEPTGTAFGLNNSTVGLSSDLTQSVLWMNQPIAGPASPKGTNLYLRRADGTIVPLTNTGPETYSYGGELTGASQDFTRLFIVSTVKQLDEDPTGGGNLYEWTNGKLSLVAILPGEVLAPNGGALATIRAALPAVSDDGTRALFTAVGLPDLYLRIDGSRTVNVSRSRRAVADPNPHSAASPGGMSADGGTVLFTSHSELTEDAYTGRTGGVSTDLGADLYSYDVETEELTDLTVDKDLADKETGAGVEHIVGASRDASYVYFIATGNLAPGATSGARNLYAEHDGEIKFVGTNPFGNFEQGYPFYVTPSGKYAAFYTTEAQTGYDNASKTEVYKYTYGGALECASCRVNGEPPTGDASIAERAISDDGSRLFFQSNDAVVPQAGSGRYNVFEYEGGQVHLLTPGGGAAAVLAGASSSGDDVFIATFEELAQGDGPVFAIYDARVGAQVPPVTAAPKCQGENCRGSGTAAPQIATPGTASFEANGKVTVFGSSIVKGTKAELRVVVPGSGRVSIAGQGLKPIERPVSKEGSVTFLLSLKSSAEKKLHNRGVFRTKPEILFRSPTGATSRADFSLKFEASKKKRSGR